MAEAEDVIVDVARHATDYVQQLWRSRHPPRSERAPELGELAPRLSLLLTALYAEDWTFRVAQPPPPVTTLKRLFQSARRPWPELALPSSAGRTLWLPRRLQAVDDAAVTIELYRAMSVQQAARAELRPVDASSRLSNALAQEIYLVLEAEAADTALASSLPGLAAALAALRHEALRRRPPLEAFAPQRRSLERWFRRRREAAVPAEPFEFERLVRAACDIAATEQEAGTWGTLFKDWWTGDWPPRDAVLLATTREGEQATGVAPKARSANLARRPNVREANPDEDDADPGAFMIQTSQPHEHAEDPFGAQRPTDRDADSAAEGHAESVAELAEARLVRSAHAAHEVLLSDDLPALARQATTKAAAPAPGKALRYPEWDYRQLSYRDAEVSVWETLAEPGPEAWVARTLEAQRPMLLHIRRQFEMLRAKRVMLHRQEDGDELDLDACIEARADVRGGAALPERLYRQSSVARRDTAVLVLVDVSGSTDGWLAGARRIIDVEREALLPLSVALDGLGEPYAIIGFSGEGPEGVVVRTVKRFDEKHSHAVALRIAGLEPEHYTRAGAALRHASQLLAKVPARHRLLLLLSDGKPNDCDVYEGRYGVEDTRQAVFEARRAGLSTFCLTVDRQASSYLPRVFGPHHYAMLQEPERLPAVLLDWMKRLLQA